MGVSMDNAIRARTTPRTPRRLRRGRTRILAVSDVLMLVLAYAATYAVADRIAPLPPVSAAMWLLLLVGATAPVVWLGLLTAHNLYDNDSLRISVSSFDEVRDLFHALLVGSLGYLMLSQLVDHFFHWWIYTPVEAFLFVGAALVFVPVARGSIRSGSRVVRARCIGAFICCSFWKATSNDCSAESAFIASGLATIATIWSTT
jgi:hypothetical protein